MEIEVLSGVSEAISSVCSRFASIEPSGGGKEIGVSRVNRNADQVGAPGRHIPESGSNDWTVRLRFR